jgi:uncharacterized membrane protein YdjX (TVP38/TMEM64 family)
MDKEKRSISKLIFMVLLILVVVLVGNYTSAGSWFNLNNITTTIRDFGVWGYLVFLCLFVGGSFIQAPAMLFVLASMLTYGDLLGAIVGFVGVVVSILFNFYFIRVLGGKVLEEIEWPLVRRILSQLDKKPFKTVFLLRQLLWASPVLNFTLAMTKIKSSHYIVGSIIGIIPPIIIFCSAVYFFKEKIIPLF